MIVASNSIQVVTLYSPWLLPPIGGVVKGVPIEVMSRAIRWLWPLSLVYLTSQILLLAATPVAPEVRTAVSALITILVVGARVLSMPLTAVALSGTWSIKRGPIVVYAEHLIHHCGLTVAFVVGLQSLLGELPVWGYATVVPFAVVALGPVVFSWRIAKAKRRK